MFKLKFPYFKRSNSIISFQKSFSLNQKTFTSNQVSDLNIDLCKLNYIISLGISIFKNCARNSQQIKRS